MSLFLLERLEIIFAKKALRRLFYAQLTKQLYQKSQPRLHGASTVPSQRTLGPQTRPTVCLRLNVYRGPAAHTPLNYCPLFAHRIHADGANSSGIHLRPQ